MLKGHISDIHGSLAFASAVLIFASMQHNRQWVAYTVKELGRFSLGTFVWKVCQILTAVNKLITLYYSPHGPHTTELGCIFFPKQSPLYLAEYGKLPG